MYTVHEICITGKLIIFCITLAMHGPNKCEYVIHHAIDAWILLHKCEYVIHHASNASNEMSNGRMNE